LHKSEGLKDLIQRSLTKNYESIKEYILSQPQRFFNSLVLAVYDDSPKWIEVELQYEGEEYFNLGFLDFSGEEKIFPVDGQHRVEGIKSALQENPELGNEMIGVIFIGHSKDEAGMQKSRRLFTTLNRYAKPVTMDDIIALDEDDSVAIVTRTLLEEFSLFTNDRVTKSKNKAISDADKKSITSIITLYQCNLEILKLFRQRRKKQEPNRERDSKGLNEYLKFRPNQKEINLYQKLCFEIWSEFYNQFDEVKEYLENQNNISAQEFRNKDTGGNLLFRPVGLLPFIQATLEIHRRSQHDFNMIFRRYNQMDFQIDQAPWKNVLWNNNEKTMIMGASGLVKLLLIYMFDSELTRPSELKSLKYKYADKVNFEGENLDGVLDLIPIY
jgi:DNA sulfur modification protein DndB